jgi:hypothetical protein
MEQYWEDFDLEEIHFRDKWQFELKSHYLPSSKMFQHIYTQELYLYIPSPLQVNPETYSKEQFYQDKTNLIRYKTPEFTFQQLIDPTQTKSPLYRIKNGLAEPIERELKLLGNMVRSTLRTDVNALISALQHLGPEDEATHFIQPVTTLLIHFNILLTEYDALEIPLMEKGDEQLAQAYIYVADFISFSSNNYFTALLDNIRKQPREEFASIDKDICELLMKEKKWREKWLDEPEVLSETTTSNEKILYQIGLLNKYVVDALLLNISVDPIDQRFRNIIGSIAAALAMTIYILLFVWQGSVFIINSEPFILFTIFIYVLKDRVKDEIKNISMKQAFRWFSDYKTEIRTPDNKTVIGELRESFSYIDPDKVPEDIQKVRNIEQHKTLQAIRRVEQVMYYKKTVYLNNFLETKQDRFSGLNVIFRLDIHKFLNKASDSIQPYSTLDPNTLEVTHTMLPKVYHLNIVLKNSFLRPDGTTKTEYKKHRIIANKEGILRLENLS